MQGCDWRTVVQPSSTRLFLWPLSDVTVDGVSWLELLLAVVRGKHQAPQTYETEVVRGAPHKILPQKPFPPLERHMYNRQITHSIEQSRHAGNSCGCLPAE